MKGRNLPNLISLFRVLLVGPVVVLLLEQHERAALVLFAVAGLSDALDGYLAKRYGWTSRAGAILDPLADKLLLVATYVTLGWLAALPLWLVAAVLGRDLAIVAGGVAYHLRFGPFQLRPSLISKINTAAQIGLVLAVIFDRGVYRLDAAWLTALTDVVLVTTVASGVGYIGVWGRRAWRAGRGSRRSARRCG
mgnify:CR=1 FL=1